MLHFWRAPTPAGRTLLTTRDATVAAGFAEERLEELGEEDALRLLSRFRPITESERTSADALAGEVGRHTLALMLLGERVRRDGDYAKTLQTLWSTGRLARLEKIAKDLQEGLGAASTSIVASFRLSIRPLRKDAKRLLALTTVCAPNEAIPRGLLRSAFGGDEAGDAFADGVDGLLAASLLGERRGEDAVDIHPLVANVAARLLGVRLEREGEAIAQALLPRISRSDAADDILRHAEIADDIVHARHLTGLLENELGIALGLWIGHFERARGLYAAARVAEANALDAARKVLGDEHPNTLTSMNNLAETLRAQGDLPGARALQEQVLEVRRRVLGEEHPNTLTSMNNLAGMLRAQGDLPGARALRERMLEVSRRVLGEDHPNTVGATIGVIVIAGQQGDREGVDRLMTLLPAALANQVRAWLQTQSAPGQSASS